MGDRVEGKKEDKMGISRELSQYDHYLVVRQTRNPDVTPKLEKARTSIKLGDEECIQWEAPSMWERKRFFFGGGARYRGMEASDSEVTP